jgi:alanine dehydrogenase
LGTDDNSADLLYPSEVAQARLAAERMGWRLGKRRGGKFMLIDTWGGVIAAEVTLREVWEAINRPSSVRYRRPQRPSP